jgi:putative oxidoreductase
MARFIVGWIFLERGWNDLNDLYQVRHDLAHWGIPSPHILAPLLSALEVAAGVFMLLGLVTRVTAVVLATVTVLNLARIDPHSLVTFVASRDAHYLVLFIWLAVAGAGIISLDSWIQQNSKPPAKK